MIVLCFLVVDILNIPSFPFFDLTILRSDSNFPLTFLISSCGVKPECGRSHGDTAVTLSLITPSLSTTGNFYQSASEIDARGFSPLRRRFGLASFLF